MTDSNPNPDVAAVQRLTVELADHLQQLMDAGANPGHVADAAMAAGMGLRLRVSGPLTASRQLSALAKRAALDAVVEWAMREHAKAHPNSVN